MKRFLGKFLAMLAVLLPLASPTAQTVQLDAIVAIVNEDVVTASQLAERLSVFREQAANLEGRQLPPENIILSQILERLILESIQLQEAERHNVVISDEALTEAIRNYAGRAGTTLESLRDSLEQQGTPYRVFREEFREQMLLERIQRAMVDRRIFINEQDVRDFRASPFFELMARDEFRVGHILLSVDSTSEQAVAAASKRAEEIVQELRRGQDFTVMAINHSAASTALEGGDLGWRQLSQLPSLFVDVVAEMAVGETADPIQNPLGFHIIQLLEKRGASTQQGERFLVRHILLQPSTIRSSREGFQLISDIRQQILDGADFAELAREHSDDPGSAHVGGELGWTDTSSFVPEFAKAVRESEVGKVSEPFSTDYGWHILEVVDRRVEDLSEDAKDRFAFQILYQRQFNEKLEEWLKQIRDEAFVKLVDRDA